MNKQDRDFYISIGICPKCKRRPLEVNRKMCYECLGRERDRYYHRKNFGILDDQSKKKNEHKMQIYYERKQNGICTRCGKKEAQHGLLCNRCYSTCRVRAVSKVSDIDRSERPSYGICYICGKAPVINGKKVCERCYETRMKTMPKMWERRNNEYFKRLNSSVFKSGQECI